MPNNPNMPPDFSAILANPEQKAILDNIVAQQKKLVVDFYTKKISETNRENEMKAAYERKINELRMMISEEQHEGTRLRQQLELASARLESEAGSGMKQQAEQLAGEIANSNSAYNQYFAQI